MCLTLKSTDCGREASLRPKDAAFVDGQTTKTNKVNVCLIKVAVMFLIFENLLHSHIHLAAPIIIIYCNFAATMGCCYCL